MSLKKTLEKQILRIPIVGKGIQKIYRFFVKKKTFTTSAKYWEERYSAGGNSGDGSYNNLAEFKAEVINEFVKDNNIHDVIEFGCGDGNQLTYFNFKKYTGVDVSQKAISNCKLKFSKDVTKQFVVLNEYSVSQYDLALSLDVIYHLVEDETYNSYMKMLFASSKKYVCIYSSNDDNHENNSVSVHVRHRKFTNWIQENAKDFKQIKFIPNRFPFNGDSRVSSYADFYFFEKP